MSPTENGGLIKAGAGVLTLSAPNSYSLGTLLTGGTLSVSADNRLGSGGGALTFDGGSLRVTGNSFGVTPRSIILIGSGGIDIADAGNVFVVGQTITGVGGLVKSGSGTLVLDVANTYGGGTTVVAGTLAVTDTGSIGAAPLTLTGGRFLANEAGLSFANAVTANGGALDTSDQILTLTGLVEGGAMTKLGSGTLVLDHVNSFSGGLTVTNGTVAVLQSGALGTGTAQFVQGTTLRFDADATLANSFSMLGTVTVDTQNHDGAIGATSGVNLTKTGTGTLTLSAANTYSGATSVDQGTLVVAAANTGEGTVTVANGATLAGGGSVAGNVVIPAGGTISPGTGAGAGTLGTGNLLLTAGSLLNFGLATPGVVGGGVNDLINVTGNLDLAGSFNITALAGFNIGTYRLIDYTGTLTPGAYGFGPLPLGYNPGDFVIDTSVLGQVRLNVTNGGIRYWDGNGAPNDFSIAGGDGTWNATNTNWTSADGSVNSVWGSATGIFRTVGGNVGVTSALAFTDLRFEVDGYTLFNNGGDLRPTGTGVIDTLGAGNTTTISATITGAGSLDKQGAGTLVLSGANSFAGGVTLTAGILRVASTGALGNGVFNVAAGTTVVLDNGFANNLVIGGGEGTSTTFQTGTLLAQPTGVQLPGTISGTGALRKTGASELRLTAANGYGGGTFIDAGTIRVSDASGFGSGQIAVADGATLGVNAAGLTIGNAVALSGLATIGTSINTLTLSGKVSGTGTLVKRESGTLVLTNLANDYSGGTSIREGTLSVADDRQLGALTGNIDFEGIASKTLLLTQDFSSARSVVLGDNAIIDGGANAVLLTGVISNDSTLTKSGSGVLTLTGINSYTGGTLVGAGTLSIGADANLGAALGGLRLNEGATLRLTSSLTSARGIVVAGTSTIDTVGEAVDLFAGNVSNSGGLTKTGAGELALSGNNSGFTGGITVAQGTLSLFSSNAAGAVASTITTTGSTINYGNGVTIANPLIVNSNSTNLQVLTGLATQAGVISQLGGARPLTKTGGGTLVLSGTNTNSGLFSVNAGTIGIANNQALGTGGVALANGTTLQARAAGYVVGNNIALTGTGTIDTNGFGVFPATGLTLSGTISGSGALRKISGGNLALTGTNTYFGGTTLNGGGISITDDANLGDVSGNFTFQSAGLSVLATTGDFASRPQLRGDECARPDRHQCGQRYRLERRRVGRGRAGQGGFGLTDADQCSEQLYRHRHRRRDADRRQRRGARPRRHQLLEHGHRRSPDHRELRQRARHPADDQRHHRHARQYADAQQRADRRGRSDQARRRHAGAQRRQQLRGRHDVERGHDPRRQRRGTRHGHAGDGGRYDVASGRRSPDADQQHRADGQRHHRHAEASCSRWPRPGSITGGGSLTKIGSGTLVLNGANGYTGGTNLNAGQITVGTSKRARHGRAGDGERRRRCKRARQRLTLANSIGLTGSDTVDTNGFDLTLAAPGSISGAGSLNKIGAGILTLNGANSYTLGTNLNAGQITVGTNERARHRRAGDGDGRRRFRRGPQP